MTSENDILKVTENEDGSFTFEWDPEDPVACIFNDWAEQDWIEAIMYNIKKS